MNKHEEIRNIAKRGLHWSGGRDEAEEMEKEKIGEKTVNIYDELLKIVEEAKVHNIHQDYFGCVQFEQALERAKKVEELLELYRKHINNLCKQEREGVKNSLFSSEFIAYELYEQIKQKEKELVELK